MKVGIIGANWSLKVHGAAWKMFPGVEVAAVCTAHRETAERAAAEYGVPRAYWNTRDLAADPDVDIIDVGSRPAFRPPMVMDALRGGKHVYNALPFATTMAEATEQAFLARSAGLIGVVDAQFRWVPAAMQMKRMIDDGFIGRPFGFTARLALPFVNEASNYYSFAAYPPADVQPYKWLAEKASGASAWRNYGTHMLLLLTHMIGPVDTITGMTTTGAIRWDLPDGSKLHPETDDLGCAVLKMCNGALGTLTTSWSMADADYVTLDIWGEKGRLHYSDRTFGDGISATLYAGDTKLVRTGASLGSQVEIDDDLFCIPGLGIKRADIPPYMVSMGWMFHSMLEAIAGRGKPSPSFDEALHAHAVVEALFASETEGKPIQIDEATA